MQPRPAPGAGRGPRVLCEPPAFGAARAQAQARTSGLLRPEVALAPDTAREPPRLFPRPRAT